MVLLSLSLAYAQAVPASPDYAGNCQAPRWSADGGKLSWEVNYHDRKTVELYIATYGATTQPRKVTPVSHGASASTAGFATATADAVVHEASWSPASIGKIVYSASGTSEDYDLYIDGAGPVAMAAGADGSAAWSPDGKRIVFTSARSGQGDLYMIDLAAVEKPPLKLTGDPTASELFAAWSPDGQKVAFVGHTQAGDNLYLIDNVAFPAPRAFTTWEHTQTRPSFSPDGSTIAFYSNHSDLDRFDLYMAPLSGTPVLVAMDVIMNDEGPTWTPDGRHLVYVKHDDSRFNPVYAAPVRQPSQAVPIQTGTVGNADLDVVKRSDGNYWLVVSAVGRTKDKVRDFKRLYSMPLPALP